MKKIMSLISILIILLIMLLIIYMRIPINGLGELVNNCYADVYKNGILEFYTIIKDKTDLKEENIDKSNEDVMRYGHKWFKISQYNKILVGSSLMEIWKKPPIEKKYNLIINCYLDRKLKNNCLQSSDFYGSTFLNAAIKTFLKETTPESKKIIKDVSVCGIKTCSEKTIKYKDWTINVFSVGNPIEWVKITFNY